MSIADKLTQIAENEQKVFDAGAKSEYDRFWDEFQDYGKRTNYRNAFGFAWTDEIFKPKYNLTPTEADGTTMFQNSTIVDLKGCLERQGVILDTSQCTYLLQMFQLSRIKYFPTIDGSKAINTNYAFPSDSVVSIDKFISSEVTQYGSMSFDSANMEKIIFEGTIANDGFRFSNCKKLSHESLMSIINCLKDFSGTGETRTCTLGEANLAKLTDTEKAIATEKGWTLA